MVPNYKQNITRSHFQHHKNNNNKNNHTKLTLANMQQEDKKATNNGKGFLCLIEPASPGPEQLSRTADTCWVLLHVIPPEGHIATTEEMITLSSNRLDEWFRWKQSHVEHLTGTLVFRESPLNSEDMLIETMLIEKIWRRQGFGTRLVDGMKAVCVQRGRTRILASTEFRPKALPFWRTVGLVEDEEGQGCLPCIPVSSSITRKE